MAEDLENKALKSAFGSASGDGPKRTRKSMVAAGKRMKSKVGREDRLISRQKTPFWSRIGDVKGSLGRKFKDLSTGSALKEAKHFDLASFAGKPGTYTTKPGGRLKRNTKGFKIYNK